MSCSTPKDANRLEQRPSGFLQLMCNSDSCQAEVTTDGRNVLPGWGSFAQQLKPAEQ